ncbi:MAG TPA: hypothetical protein VKX17_07890 [Planctomycetota bacterium]|nr:hypothetical protein [Planctomycetota bacterium]
MSNATITIEVDPDTARDYNAAPAEERRKLDVLLSLHLRRAMRSGRPLREVMDSISQKAQERGMTPEILEQILNER